MIHAGLWRARARPPEAIHAWRPRRSQFGELVRWDSSTHDWLEGRGPQVQLIRLIDDATSRSLLRFGEHDSVACQRVRSERLTSTLFDRLESRA